MPATMIAPKIGSRAATVCERCGKRPMTGNNRPNSLHRTKRTFSPNLAKHMGVILCSRCWRTVRKEIRPTLRHQHGLA